jgi:hypothetical protein
MELFRETAESLETARKAVSRLSDGPTGGVTSGRDVLINTALVALVDVCAQLARLVGVPNAVEPEPGAQPHVTTTTT